MTSNYEALIDVVDNGYSLTINEPATGGDMLVCSIHASPSDLGHAIEKFFDEHRPTKIRLSGVPHPVVTTTTAPVQVFTGTVPWLTPRPGNVIPFPGPDDAA